MIKLRPEVGGSRPPGAMLFRRRLAADFFGIVLAVFAQLRRATGEPDPPAHRADGTLSTQFSI
jgi:hypothetical protein